MMGYVPQILPQSYIETKTAFSGLGDTYSMPPLVQADAPNNVTGAGGFMNIFSSILGGAFQAGTQSSYEFNAAAGQLQAQRLANERSRRWGAFGALAVGIAGLVGVVYVLRK